MFVVSLLSALLKIHRSSSVYRSFSALVALIRFSHSYHTFFDCSDVYRSFAADGCIFELETLARSLGDSCTEKEYLLALVDLGRAALIVGLRPMQRYDDTVLRTELLHAISLQQYVPFSTDTKLPNSLSPERTTESRLLPLAKRPSSSQKRPLPTARRVTLLPVAPLKRPIFPFFSSCTL